jgi:hypothetical protein
MVTVIKAKAVKAAANDIEEVKAALKEAHAAASRAFSNFKKTAKIAPGGLYRGCLRTRSCGGVQAKPAVAEDIAASWRDRQRL